MDDPRQEPTEFPLEKDDKIFIYLRLRDERKIFFKSRIREFAALNRLLAESLKEIWQKFNFDSLKVCFLEYMDANSDLVLFSIRHDLVRQHIIISGVIPKEYQMRMLGDAEARLKVPLDEFLQEIGMNVGPASALLLQHRICQSTKGSILSLIRENINEYGEFYLELFWDPTVHTP